MGLSPLIVTIRRYSDKLHRISLEYISLYLTVSEFHRKHLQIQLAIIDGGKDPKTLFSNHEKKENRSRSIRVSLKP